MPACSLHHCAYPSPPALPCPQAILVERGLVDLDAPLDSYLGAAKLNPGAAGDSADGATVRRVANHTSGLPLHYHFFYEDEPYPRPPFEETILVPTHRGFWEGFRRSDLIFRRSFLTRFGLLA